MSSFDEKILNAVNDISTTNNPFKGKWVSILGDSISTYKGYIPEGNNVYYPNDDVDDVSKTWWHILLTKLGAKLCVNNSSGSRLVCDDSDNSAIVAVPTLHREAGKTYVNLDGTTEVATKWINPDIILINLGMNDFLGAKTLGEFNVKCLTAAPAESTFYDWYNYILLKTVGLSYRNAQVYCLDMTFSKYKDHFLTAIASTGATLPEYQQAIKDEARIYGLKCLHTSSICVHGANTDKLLIDKIHPKADMMKMIANQCYHEMMADNCL